MSNLLLMPQEVEVFYLIPSLRKELAIAMKERGMDQKQIAQLLGVTEAAVSNYIHQKRANWVKMNEKLLNAVEESVIRIKDTTSFVAETQKLLQLAKQERVLCQLHVELSPNIDKKCDVCFRK